LQVLLPVYICAGIPTATPMAEDTTLLVLAIFTMRRRPKEVAIITKTALEIGLKREGTLKANRIEFLRAASDN
jgi:hypothetical protein